MTASVKTPDLNAPGWFIVDTTDRVAQKVTEDAPADGFRFVKLYAQSAADAITYALQIRGRNALQA